MLRLIHAQTVQSSILVDDIDDGLPNKEVHRLTGNPKAYPRDGYANKVKQKCYVPYSKVSSGLTLAGWIDINESDKVTLSNFKGKISKMKTAGLISVTSFTAANVAAPVLTSAATNTPGAGDLTITGTTMTSVAPDVTSVYLTTPNAFLVVTGAANGNVKYVAVAAGSSGTAVTIAHVVAGANTPLTVGVSGNAITVNVATNGGSAATSTATQVAAAIAGSGPAAALVTATALGSGAGVVGAKAPTALAIVTLTFTAAQIVAASGTVSATSIFIPAASVPGIFATVVRAQIQANNQLTSVVALT